MLTTLRSALSRFANRREEEEKRRHAMVGPPELWTIKRDFQIGFLKAAGLTPTDHLLDIGCGTLRGGIPMIEYLEAGHYHGVEQRGECLVEARKELRKHRLESKKPVLTVAETLTGLDLKQSFDVIWAFSVLIHMDDDTLQGCLAFIRRHLQPSGTFYANVNLGPTGPLRGWQGYPVVQRPMEFYEQAARTAGLEASDLGPLHEHGHPPDAHGLGQHVLRFVAV